MSLKNYMTIILISSAFGIAYVDLVDVILGLFRIDGNSILYNFGNLGWIIVVVVMLGIFLVPVNIAISILAKHKYSSFNRSLFLLVLLPFCVFGFLREIVLPHDNTDPEGIIGFSIIFIIPMLINTAIRKYLIRRTKAVPTEREEDDILD